MESAPPLEELIAALGTGVLRPLLCLHPNVSTNEPDINAENRTTDLIIAQLPPYMRDHSIAFQSMIKLYYQNSKNGLLLLLSLGDMATTIYIDSLPMIEQDFISPDMVALVQQLLLFAI